MPAMPDEPSDREWKLPWEAHCRCGRVRLRVSAPPLLTLACHCEGCQRMTASAYSLSIAVPAPAFAVIEGTPEIGGLHGASRHYHCPHCKSWPPRRLSAAASSPIHSSTPRRT